MSENINVLFAGQLKWATCNGIRQKITHCPMSNQLAGKKFPSECVNNNNKKFPLCDHPYKRSADAMKHA